MDEIARRLKQSLPGLRILGKEVVVGNRRFDLHARDSSGTEYFIEIKRSRPHRVVIGQIVEMASTVADQRPNAKMLLVCPSIEPAVKEVLSKAGIETLVLPEIEAVASRRDRTSEPRPGMSPTEQGAYFALLRKERKVVTTEDFALLYGIPAHRARSLLSALAGRGVVYRLGRGRYAVLPPDILYDRKSYTADPYTVTDAVMEGERYFVSYVSAAHLHGIVTQAPITVLVSTLKQRRPVELETGRIRFVTISRDRFFGTEQTSYFGSSHHRF